MRTLLLVTFTAFALALGYMAYWWMQPADKVRLKRAGQTEQPLQLQTRQSDQPYGPGKGVWVKRYHIETGELLSRFKGDEFKPRNDGWVEVRNPRSQFFMKDGRAISIEGTRGEIVMDDQKNKTGMKAFQGSRENPSRGRLHDVTIRLYHDLTDPETQLADESAPELARDHRALTITLQNAAFDNEAFRIYSEGYREKGGKRVTADWVPVQLRGDEYDFDGYGMVIRWNERDQRLAYLEVAHGEKLVIKSPGKFMKPADPAAAPVVAQLDDWSSGLPLPIMLAARGRAAVGEAIAASTAPTTAPATAPTTRRSRGAIPKPRIKPSNEPKLYRAIFSENVQITQGEDVVVNATKMAIDFLMEDQKADDEKPGATTRPGTNPATTQAATQPAARRRRGDAATTGPTTRRAKGAAATQPGGETPLVITWSGPLTVEPLPVGTQAPLEEGEAIVRLDGTPAAPVTALQNGSTIICGILTYWTQSQSMALSPAAPDKPVVLKDAKGTLVQTTRMDFSQPRRQAVLYGASTASFPQERDDGKAADPMVARWNKSCTLHFADQPKGAPGGDMNIERAELDGDVFVTHPQLKLKSQTLDLSFDTQKARAPGSPVTRPVEPALNVAAAKKTLAELDAKITTLVEAMKKGPALEQAVANVARLEAEYDLAKDVAAARRESGDTLKKLEQGVLAARAELERQQNLVVQVQDLQSERKTLARRIAMAPSPATGPAATNPAAGTRPAGAATRPAMRAELKQLVATGTVRCEMIDSAKKTQTIDCSRLTLQTAMGADGRMYPSTVNADGDVHAVDTEQDLRAGHLAVTLRPATQPSKAGKPGSNDTAPAELQSMIAHNNVKVISKDGTVATADQLLVDNKDGKNNVKLLGQPHARIVDARKNVLSGPIIEIDPDAQRLEVVGTGTMVATQEARQGQAGRPVDVRWNRSMSFDGRANIADVVGDVQVVSKDADGTENTARGQRVRMLLADLAPTTKPAKGGAATQPASTQAVAVATTQGADKPAKSASAYGGTSNKTIKSITFNDDAEVSSVLLADNGNLLRRTHLLASVIHYEMLAKRLTIPVEGKMIVEDHREGKPAAAGAAGGGNAGQAQDNRGTTAFQWTKRFTYDDATKQAIMEGGPQKPVIVAHRDDTPDGKLFRLNGDLVTAELEEVAAPVTQPKAGGGVANPAAGAAAAQQPKMQIKRVTATGHLLFQGPGAEVMAHTMEFDPKTNWLVARGSGRDGVEFDIQSIAGGRQTADEVQYNTQTTLGKATNARVRMGR